MEVNLAEESKCPRALGLTSGLFPIRPGFTVWFTGLPCAGKTTIAERVVLELAAWSPVEWLDGDVVRTYLSRGLGFSREDRNVNVLRVGYVAHLLNRNGVAVVVSLISPYRAARELVRRQIDRFVEVYVDTPLEECIRRDVKGLYQRALAGEILNFTGISDPYEPPLSPEVVVRTLEVSPDRAATQVLAALERLGYLSPAGEDGSGGLAGDLVGAP